MLCVSSISCVYLMRLSNASVLCSASISSIRVMLCVHLCYAVRPCASISCVYLMRLRCSSSASISSISCVHFVHLVCVMLCVHLGSSRLCLPVCSYQPPYASLNMLNPLTPLSVSSCSFDPFQIFRAFDSYNYPDNSSVYLIEHCNALKSISLSEGKSPRGSKCLTRLKCSESMESMERLKGFEGFGGSH